MRNISFMLTQPQFLDRSKTVTRRLKWKNLKVGQQLCGVKKCMGFKKGEKIERLGIIEVVSVRRESLNLITKSDVLDEGFPELLPCEFVDMFCNHMKCDLDTEVTRIEFKYVEIFDQEEGAK